MNSRVLLEGRAEMRLHTELYTEEKLDFIFVFLPVLQVAVVISVDIQFESEFSLRIIHINMVGKTDAAHSESNRSFNLLLRVRIGIIGKAGVQMKVRIHRTS